jgi:hypothetical protein
VELIGSLHVSGKRKISCCWQELHDGSSVVNDKDTTLPFTENIT